MAIDTGIWANANKPTVALQDPNAVMQQAASAANAVNQNRLFQGQQAVGRAYQQATGPDGSLDVNRLRMILAQDPTAAPAMQEAQTAAQGLGVSQQGMALKNLQAQSAALGSLQSLNGGHGPTHDQVVQQLQQGLSQGWLQPHNANAVLTGMPTGDEPQDMATRLQMLRVMDQQLNTAGERLQTATGTAGTRTDNQTNQPIMTGGLLSPQPGGQTPVGAATPLYLSPSELASRTTTGLNPDGSVRTGPLATVTPPRLAGPAGTPSPLGTGRLPAGLLNPARAAGASATAPSPVAPAASTPVPSTGEVTTSQGPAQIAAQSAGGAASAGAFKDIADQGVAATSRGAVLDNMLSDTKQFTSGPGNDQILKMRQVAGRLGLPVDTTATTSAESFNKLAAQLANQQGGGTDARLSVSQAGNPHGDLSPDGLDQMVRQLRGNEDYLGARAKLAAAYPNQADRSGFEAQQASQLDPRTFQYDRLNPSQKATYFKNLDDKAAFVRAHDASAKLLGRGQ